jgi:hypothetical protein
MKLGHMGTLGRRLAAGGWRHGCLRASARHAASVAVLLALGVATAAAQMPDVSQMSGMPLPTGDLDTGTVSVRVVGTDLTDAIAGVRVELHGGGRTWEGTTDEEGRATFTGLMPGTTVHAMALVNGRQIESRDFQVPPQGGMRVMLSAAGGPPAGGPPAAADGHTHVTGPVEPGTVVFGGQSRFIVELVDEALEVYYLFEVANPAETAVATEPIVIVLPEEAVRTTVLEGSSPAVTAEGRRVTITGPFPPGHTIANVAYHLPYSGPRVRIEQPLPVALSQVSTVVRQFGDLTFSSPQVVNRHEMQSDGQTYYTGGGPGLAAGSTIVFDVAGLPHRPSWPKNVALVLALGVLGLGVWSIVAGTRPEDALAKTLSARRDQLMGELVKIERQHLGGHGDQRRYAARRRELMSQLERIYAELDELGAAHQPTVGGGDGPSAPAPVGANVSAAR